MSEWGPARVTNQAFELGAGEGPNERRGPGGYRFADFLRAGLPVTVAVGATTIALAPLL